MRNIKKVQKWKLGTLAILMIIPKKKKSFNKVALMQERPNGVKISVL